MIQPDFDNKTSLESDVQTALGSKYDVGVFSIDEEKLLDSEIIVRPSPELALPVGFCVQFRVEQEIRYGIGMSLVLHSLDWDEAENGCVAKSDILSDHFVPMVSGLSTFMKEREVRRLVVFPGVVSYGGGVPLGKMLGCIEREPLRTPRAGFLTLAEKPQEKIFVKNL
ncbi:hypothetical protein JW710_03555 [Candidatus Dojkabacteria bacterium]|nr:hypothetical protein [Candidatus Dojkabacteria bacterium]